MRPARRDRNDDRALHRIRGRGTDGVFPGLPNAPRVEGTSAELMESLRRMNVPTRLDQVRRFVVLVVNSVTGPE